MRWYQPLTPLTSLPYLTPYPTSHPPPFRMRWYQPLTRLIPYLTLPYLTLPYLTLPYLILPYLTLPYLTLPYFTLPYLILPYLTLSYLTLPYLTLPYLTLTYLILPYLTLPYLTLSYPTSPPPPFRMRWYQPLTRLTSTPTRSINTSCSTRRTRKPTSRRSGNLSTVRGDISCLVSVCL